MSVPGKVPLRFVIDQGTHNVHPAVPVGDVLPGDAAVAKRSPLQPVAVRNESAVDVRVDRERNTPLTKMRAAHDLSGKHARRLER